MSIFINLLININFLHHAKVKLLVTVFRFITLSRWGNLFVLTFNRFLSLYNSLRYPAQMTVSKAKYLTLLPWFIAFFLSILYTSFQWTNLSSYLVGVYYIALVLSIASLNIYIFKMARDKSKVIKRLERAVQAPKTAKREYRLTVRLLLISFMVFGSSVPLMVLGAKYESKESTAAFVTNFLWSTVALLLNTIIDPIIYSSNHPIFKRYYEKIRNRLCRRNVVVPSRLRNHNSETNQVAKVITITSTE